MVEVECEECGAILFDGDVTVEKQKHPIGETHATETIVTGYDCPECGHSV